MGLVTCLTSGSPCAGARLLPLRLDHLWERVFSMARLLPGRLKLLPLSIACCVPEGCLARRPPHRSWLFSAVDLLPESWEGPHGLSGGTTSVRKGLAPRGNSLHRSSGLELLAEVGGADCGSGLLLGLAEACGAWHGPSHLMFPDPHTACPPAALWNAKGLPGSGTQPPSSPQLPPHTSETPASGTGVFS